MSLLTILQNNLSNGGVVQRPRRFRSHSDRLARDVRPSGVVSSSRARSATSRRR